jgi:hypothetical protein
MIKFTENPGFYSKHFFEYRVGISRQSFYDHGWHRRLKPGGQHGGRHIRIKYGLDLSVASRFMRR